MWIGKDFEIIAWALKEVVILSHGFIILILLIPFILLLSPIYLYRFLVTEYAKRWGKLEIVGPLAGHANGFSIEFLPSAQNSLPKSVLGNTAVLEGNLGIEEPEELIIKKWLKEDCGYPEFKQYVERWMGFMFWKQDIDFDIRNHLKTAKLEGETEQEVERTLNLFIEELMNKPFPQKRSPWECYLINDYRNEQLGKGELTLLVFRFHHCLADGYSVVHAIVEGLCGTSLQNVKIASPTKSLKPQSFREKLGFAIKLPFKFIYDISQYAALLYSPKTPIHAFAKKEIGARTLYERCPEPIPLQRVKDIKNRFGVTFTAVLLSAISAGMSKTLHSLPENKTGKKGKSIESMAFLVPFPLQGHPGKLQNHVTGTYLELPITHELGSMERLQKVEKILISARNSIIPIILPWVFKAAGCLFPCLTSLLIENRVMPAGFTNVPAPQSEVYMAGRKGLTAEMFVGTLPGVMGVSFQMLSSRAHFRLAVGAEQEVMDRDEVKELIKNVVDELELLYELSTK